MKIQLSDHFDYKRLIQFTAPMIGTMLVTSVFGSVDDGFFVSNYAGKDAFAAINIILPGVFVLGSFGFIFGSGGSALVSKTMGEGNKEQANRYFSMLIELLVILGIAFSVFGFIFIKPLSVLLGADEITLPYCIIYGRICFVFLTINQLQMCFQNFLAVAEKPKFVFKITVTVMVVNTLLDFILVYWLRMGVVGAALATCAGQVIGGIWPLIYFINKNDSSLRLSFTPIEIKPIVQTFSNGLSEMVSNIAMNLAFILFNLQLIKYLGNDGVVAYGVIAYISFIFVGVYLGYSMGVAPVFSYHYGAANHSELKNLYDRSLKLLVTAALCLTAICYAFARPLSWIFTSYDKNLMELTIHAVRVYCLSFLISEINMFASSFFTALNNGVVSAIISFARTFLFQVIAIYILPEYFGVDGIWFAVTVGEISTLVVSVYFLISQKKKYHY